jgi:N6-adenosine-specific RNA methylase IME4
MNGSQHTLPPPAQEFRSPSEIKVGDRFRKERDDIIPLVRSINARGGLIHPPAVTASNELIAGERRLLAWQHAECRFRDQLIPVTVIDVDDIVTGEWDENDPVLRKPFTPSEIVAIKRFLEPRLKAEAKERQREHGGTAPGKHSGDIPQSDVGRAVDKLGAFVGKDRKTIEKAEAVVAAAEQDPEKFGSLVEAMDRTGHVNGPWRHLQNIKAAEAINNPPAPLPNRGPYVAGIIDFPWASEPDDEKDHGARGYYLYPTMTLKQAAAFPVPSILAPNCSVWLWITNFHLMRGHHLPMAQAWGLMPVALLTWIKPRWGQGQRVRGATEHLVQMIRGNVPCLGSSTKSWFGGEGGEHSQKPARAYEIVERLTPAPRYFELFARGGERDGWDMHGNEIGKLIAPPAQKPAIANAAAPIPSVLFQPDDGLDLPNFLRIGHPECNWREPPLGRGR